MPHSPPHPRLLPGILYGFLFFLPLFSSAQQSDIQFQHIGPQEGLSKTMIFEIYQDVHGFIWFENFRYDGRKIKPYPKGNIAAVRVGELLAKNWGEEPDSLFYYDPLRDAFVDNYPDGIKPLYGPANFGWGPENCSRCQIRYDAENIWFGSPNEGLFIYHQPSKSFRRIRHQPERSAGLSSDRISTMLKDQEEQMWIGTWDAGLNLWLRDSTIEHLRYDPENPHSLSSDSITVLKEDRQGVIWVGTYRGLNRLDPSTGNITRIPLPGAVSPVVINLFIDSYGRLWISSLDEKASIYNPESETFQLHLDEKKEIPVTAYANNQIFSIAEDEQGNIWLGSAGKGLYRRHPRSKETAHYQFDPSDEESLSDNNIRAVMTDRSGRLWIGTFNGVNLYDPNAKAFAHWESSNDATFYFNSRPKYDGMEDKKGNIWIADYGGGLIRYNPQRHHFKKYGNTGGTGNSFISNNMIKVAADDAGNIWCCETANAIHVLKRSHNTFSFKQEFRGVSALYKDSAGRMWAGGNDGLAVFSDAESSPTIYHWNSFNGALGNLVYFISNLTEGCSGDFWIATMTDGLFKIDWDQHSIKQFLPNPKNPTSIADEEIWDVAIDGECNFWMAMPRQGLSMLPHDQQEAEHPVFLNWNTENSNLPDNGVHDVCVDKQGRIWVASTLGISQFDRVNKTFHTYGPESGMKTIPNGMIPAQDGGIYIRGPNGIGYFHPDKLAENTHIPPVYLKDIQIDGKSLPIAGSLADTLGFPSPLKHSITFTKEIRLKYDQNDIRLEFIALNYTAPEQNQFEYQLIGEDEDWQSTDAVNPYATYTNLDPGEYTFRVRGANNDGYWNREGATLSILITPPWWATLWAYLLYALIVFSIIALVYRFQLNRRLAEAEARRLQELDSVKTRLYTNITHEFRTPLTVIEGMADQIREDPKQWLSEGLDLIKRNSRRLLQLVNQMLALRKLESGNMPVQMVHGDVVKYLRYVLESFHAHAESKDIRLHFLCEQEKIDMDYDPEKLQTIVANLLSNAIKFTPTGGDVYLQAGIGKTENGIIQSEGALTNSDFRPPSLRSGRVNLPPSNHLLLSVKDTGAGIPEDQLAHIFDRFYQADTGSTRGAEGTGIGLTLTKELVRLLNGDIFVGSKLGKGTSFTVLLPVTKEAEKVIASETIRSAVQTAAHEAPTAPEPNFPEVNEGESNPPSDLPRALIIEDNQDVTRYLQACLQGQYEIETASDGQKGMEKAIETVPDIIISDVMMPGKDGFEVCRTLKQDFRTSHIPILLLTAKADRDSKLEGLEQGADAYLTKPFDKAELEVRLRKLIELRRQLQERYGGKPGFARFQQSGKSPVPADPEDAFLRRLRETLEANISDENYGISELCRDLGVSRTQLHRKLRALTGQSTSHHIRSIRLERAKELLETTEFNVSEVAFEVGFSSLSYFSRMFSEYHGKTPTEVKRKEK